MVCPRAFYFLYINGMDAKPFNALRAYYTDMPAWFCFSFCRMLHVHFSVSQWRGWVWKPKQLGGIMSNFTWQQGPFTSGLCPCYWGQPILLRPPDMWRALDVDVLWPKMDHNQYLHHLLLNEHLVLLSYPWGHTFWKCGYEFRLWGQDNQ